MTVLNDDIHESTLCRLLLLLIAAPREARLAVIYSVSFAAHLHFSQRRHCLIYSVGAPVVKSAPPYVYLTGAGGVCVGGGGGGSTCNLTERVRRDHSFGATQWHKLFTVR